MNNLSKIAIVFLSFATLVTLYFFINKDKLEKDLDFIQLGNLEVAVLVTPTMPTVGKNHIQIFLRTKEGEPVEHAQLRAVGEMPAMGTMPAMYAQADIKETKPGLYEGDFELSMKGSWPFALAIETSEGQHTDVRFDISTNQEGIRLSGTSPASDIAYHTCSMHPSVKSAEAGTCPICGMNLVPVTKEDLKSGSIIIPQGKRQMIGVKTGHVIRENFSVPIELQGKISFNESTLSDISLRFDGWIGDLHADYEGKFIKKNEILFTVYSPELLSLQEEYLETLKRNQHNSHANNLLDASKKRLKLWGLNTPQIEWLEKQGKAQDYVPIFSPNDGVIIYKSIIAGSAFKKGERLLRIADLSSVWIEAFAYEQDFRLLEIGMEAKVQFPNLEFKDLGAELIQIDPFIDNNSRTRRVRLQANNDDGELIPGTFVNVKLQAELGELLTIPHDAVLVSGDKHIVFLDQGEGRLKPLQIRIGYSNGERVVVRKGLSENDAIVISGNFLVAAESKLKAGLDQW